MFVGRYLNPYLPKYNIQNVEILFVCLLYYKERILYPNWIYNLIHLQKVPIIFFAAAKTTTERKISEESDQTTSEKDNLFDSGAETAESESEDEIDEKEALKSTEEDIELFTRQLESLNMAVTHTANNINKIQENLNKVLENYKLGKSIDTVQSNEEAPQTSDQKDQGSSKNVDNHQEVTNSYEIFDREKLLEVLKDQKIAELKNPPRLTVGLIGYPNVGKSSTVNILMQTKKVSIFLFQLFW